MRFPYLLLKLSTRLPLLCLALVITSAAQDIPPRVASPSEIHNMLARAVDVQHTSDAIVVGIITKHGREVIVASEPITLGKPFQEGSLLRVPFSKSAISDCDQYLVSTAKSAEVNKAAIAGDKIARATRDVVCIEII